LSLTVGDGEFVALLGPTGAGKTTTLRLIAGLEMPDNGTIRIDARDVTGDAPADRDVAFVFQQYSLYPHLTVFENMAFALRAPIRRVPEADIRAKVEEVARLLHIETKLQNKATQLSGGQMQRVAIGRRIAGHIARVNPDRPTIRHLQSGDQAQRRRLAGPRRPEQRDEFTVSDGERQIADCLRLVERLGDGPDLDLSHARLLRATLYESHGPTPCQRSTAYRA
jgi:ABC-type uncharacterized transport system YnjBCD ATPase subunit